MKNREESRKEFKLKLGPFSIEKNNWTKAISEETMPVVRHRAQSPKKKRNLWKRINGLIFSILSLYLKSDEPIKTMLLEHLKKIWLFIKIHFGID